MVKPISRIINELHSYEKILLKELEKNVNVPEDVAKITDLNIKSVMSAAGSLASKDIIDVKKDIDEFISLSTTGREFAEEGLPERRILEVLKEKAKIPMGKLDEASGLDKKEANIAIGWLRRKRWANINKGMLTITDEGRDASLGNDEKLLDLLSKKGSINLKDLSDELVNGFKALNERKNLLNHNKVTSHSFELKKLGTEIIEEGINLDNLQKEATQLTHEDLKEGNWKNLNYRPYDINAESPDNFPGKSHPLRRIIEEIREIFLNMGFTESNGDILASAFWNFDSLFQPQDHAAREMQDTFYVKNPIECDLPDDDLVKAVAKTHEDGGNTNSTGWHYKWDIDVSKQSVLRTHTTGISTRCLYDNEPPIKMFSVGRVFRRETITYKHLPEFHQVEGIVAAEDISFQNLLGILKEFYKKLGFPVRFRPAYFPYTYLSCECEIWLEEKQAWIELGGAGMFRPEVLEPLGINVPVLAFGLGIERLAMVRYDISDIRMLYKSDIKWLRNLPLDNGIKLD